MKTTKCILATIGLAAAIVACDEDNPFRNTRPLVFGATDQIWELGTQGFPSGWDFISGQRFFVGTTSLDRFSGTVVLASRPDGTLVFRGFSTIAPEIANVRTGIQDLGALSFESVREVPDGGYSAVDDTTGVPVVEGHVYAFRMTRIGGVVVPINFAKLVAIEVGTQIPGDPRSRFVRFEWKFQNQPLNRRVEEEIGG